MLAVFPPVDALRREQAVIRLVPNVIRIQIANCASEARVHHNAHRIARRSITSSWDISSESRPSVYTAFHHAKIPRRRRTLIQEELHIDMSVGVADAVVCRPNKAASPLPGVIHLTDIGGIRKSHIEMAERLAAEGYVVLEPNVFYRTGRPPVFELPPDSPMEARTKRMAELTAPLTPDAIEKDASTYVDFLLNLPGVDTAKPIGVVGYCFTGAVALRCAAARSAYVAACASFHGGRLCTDAADSPHLVLPHVRAELYFGHASDDKSMPLEKIKAFERALAAWGGQYESEIYDGAYHSWTVPDSPVYNAPQAQRAFDKLTALFTRHLH